MQELHGQHNPVLPVGASVTPSDPAMSVELATSAPTSPTSEVETARESFSDQLAHLTLRQIEASQSDPAMPLDIDAPTAQNSPTFGLLELLPHLSVETTVGEGTFGRVELVRLERGVQNPHQQQWYALKKMRIKSVIELKQVTHVQSEKEILSTISCPFIVKLYWTWRNHINIYLLMEYVSGGELFTLLRSMGRFPEPMARFYAAEIVSAFIYLHSENIVYRDLKPE